MKEAKSSIIFRHWLRENPQYTCSIEMKDTRGKSYLSFREITEAQLNYGLAIMSDKGVLIRVQAISEGMPDYIYLRSTPAWIVIKYPRSFEIISVTVFILEKNKSKSKSLTYVRAKEISTTSVALRKTSDRLST